MVPKYITSEEDITIAQEFLKNNLLYSAANHLRKGFESLFTTKYLGNKLLPDFLYFSKSKGLLNIEQYKLSALLKSLQFYLIALKVDTTIIDNIVDLYLESLMHSFSHFNENDLIFTSEIKKAINHYIDLKRQLINLSGDISNLIPAQEYLWIVYENPVNKIKFYIKIKCYYNIYKRASTGLNYLFPPFRIDNISDSNDKKKWEDGIISFDCINSFSNVIKLVNEYIKCSLPEDFSSIVFSIGRTHDTSTIIILPPPHSLQLAIP